MTDKEYIPKIHSSMYHQCKERGYATPVDVLMDLGVLTKAKYEDWLFGRVPYLEQVCTVNLRKLSVIQREIRTYARKNNLKPSFCYYKQWGTKKKAGQKRPVTKLRFSKSGDESVERNYATHFVDLARVAELKASSGNNNSPEEVNEAE